MTYQPPKDAVAAAYAYAGQCAPLEACGVIADGMFRPIANLATELDRFVMDVRGFIAISRQHKVEAVVHSHVNFPAIPSHLDLATCEKVRLPYVTLGWPAGDVNVIEPSGWKAPLEGRTWGFGTLDCFAVVRDGLAEHAGIHIPDFDRSWEFWTRGEDIITAGFAKAGFTLLADGMTPRHCDVFAMRVRSRIPNHLALFLEPDQMLHHVEGQLSRRELYSPAAQQLTAMHFRHGARL